MHSYNKIDEEIAKATWKDPVNAYDGNKNVVAVADAAAAATAAASRQQATKTQEGTYVHKGSQKKKNLVVKDWEDAFWSASTSV